MCILQRKPENDSIFKVKEYISEHFSEDITLEKMAQMVYMNPYYFSAFFKKETGENFKAYLLEVRMKKALQYLMETNMKPMSLPVRLAIRMCVLLRTNSEIFMDAVLQNIRRTTDNFTWDF